MAAPTSMSALGSFYDALYELAAKQGKKYGEGAVPDLVPGQVVDTLAQGVVTVAQTFAGSEKTVGTIYNNQIVNPLFKATGSEVGPTFTVTSPTIEGKPAGHQAYGVVGEPDEDPMAKSYGFQPLLPVGVTVSTGTAKDSLLDPVATANDIADKYWKGLVLARTVNTISDLFEDPYAKVAANMISDRSNGVDSDIAAAVAVAHDSYLGKNLSGVVRTDLFYGADPSKPEAQYLDENQARYVDWANTEYAKALAAARARDPNTPLALPEARDDFIKNYVSTARKNRISGTIDTGIALMSGIDNENERKELVDFYNKKLKEEIVKEYNTLATGTTNPQAKNYYGLFEYYKSGKKVNIGNVTDIIDPSMGGNSQGEVLQRAFTNVLARNAVDPTLSGSLQRNLMNFHDMANDQGKFGKMVVGVNTALEKGNAKPLLNNGIAEVRSAWGGMNARRDKMYDRVENSIDKEFDAPKRALARNAAYVYYRWNTMPTFTKIFSPIGVLTGSSWLQFATWSGGLTGPMTGMAIVADSLGVKKLEKKGYFDNKIAKIEKQKAFATSAHAAALTAGNTRLAAARSKDIEKYTKQLYRYQQMAGDKQNPYVMANTGMLGWKRVAVISHRANAVQKFSYRLYAYSPGAYFGGLLNGDTFQRLAWIGSGYGKNIKWKYVWNNATKTYDKVLDTSKFTRTGKWAYNMLNSSRYQSVARAARRIGWIFNAPANLTNAAIQTFQASLSRIQGNIIKRLNQTILGKIFAGALAYVTAGVSEIFRYAYMILNTVTFGGLDKISNQILRFVFQIVIGLIIGIIAFLALGVQTLTGGIGGPQYISQNLGNGGLFAPDPDYSPAIGVDTPYGNPVDPGNTQPPTPINWEDYEQYSDNLCPIQYAASGASVTNCRQGPNGTYSHHGAQCRNGPCNYAIDMAPGDSATQIVAPSDGTVKKTGITCLAGGTVIGISFTPDGGGDRYIFYHTVVKPELDGKHVTQGTVIGAMIIGESPCSSGSHVHFEVWHGSALDPHPDAAYAVMCKLGSLKCP